MVIPIPERFPPKYVALVATGLLIVQLAEGTDPLFALLCFVYMLVFATAFNASGGIYHPSGAYIFFNGFLTAVLGLFYKAFLGEPAQTHLLVPNTTLSIYCVGMAMLGVCGYVVRRLRPRQGLLANASRGEQMKRTAIGCLVLGLILQFAPLGGLASIAAQLNHFPRMAVILGTVYAIQSTNGRRSTNWIVWVASIFLTSMGLLYFSKEGIFMALTTWIVPTIVLRYNFSKFQIIGLALMIAFGLYYMVPYSQYGRRSRDDSGSLKANIEPALGYLSDLQGTRKLYLEEVEARELTGTPHFYNSDQGLFDRLQMLTPDDALFSYSLQGNYQGLIPTWASIYNVVPHFIWADKPDYVTGNIYGREIGVIDSDDTSTGISFSPFGDAFHQIGWPGLLLLLPLTILPLFYVADALSGDVRVAPWGLLYLALFVHVAPEGLLAGAVYTLFYGSEGVIFVTLLARYVLPLFNALIMGEGRKQVTAAPARLAPVRRPGSF